MQERLQKILARAGIASRRKAEELIRQGRVKVNGEVVRQLGIKVDPNHSRIEVDGRLVKIPNEFVYIALHKPRGYVTTRKDQHVPYERTVMSLLPPEYQHLHYVGRLDRDSEGLLLLTNDGELTHLVTHPRHHLEKRYIVTVNGVVTDEHLYRLSRGVTLDDHRKHRAKVRILSRQRNATTLEMVIHEGRKRQIRRMLQVVGLKVCRLVRIAVGPIKLGDLPAGKFRHLTKREVEALKRAATMIARVDKTDS